MSEEILSLDEVKRIAIEFVQQKENLGDVEITDIKLSSEIEPIIHMVQGIAREHGMSKSFVDAIIRGHHFKLCISSRDGQVIIYQPDDWLYNQEQSPLEEPQFYLPPDEENANTNYKKIVTNSYGKPKNDKTKRPKNEIDSFMKKYGFSGQKAKELRDKLGW